MANDAPPPRGLSARWSNLKVKTKILLGFGLVLLLFAGISARSYWAQTQIATSFAALARFADVIDAARDADQEFAALRRHAREFANEGEESDAKQVLEIAPRAQEALTRSLKHSVNAERRKHLQDMQEKLNVYTTAFARVVEMKRDQGKLIKETLDPVGSQVRQAFESLETAAHQAGNAAAAELGGTALRWVMRIRLSVNKVIARHDPRGLREVESFYPELLKTTEKLDAATKGTPFRGDFEKARALVTTYQTASLRAVALWGDLDGLLNGAMKRTAEEIAGDAKFVHDSAVADEHRLRTDVESLIASTQFLAVVLSLAGLAFGLGLAWLIGATIARPLLNMTAAMGKLANRDWAASVLYQDQKDEIGQMARAVQVFKDNGIENDRLAAAQKAEQDVKENRTKAIDALIANFEKQATGALQSLASAASELNATAASMAGTAEETSRQVTAVAAASEQATRNVQTVAVATEELSASVTEIGRQMEQSTRIATQAVTEAEATTTAILGLAAMARKVDSVVQIINEIAGQTNLLALNATIEAARAGEAGKGFAVVASEVKALANRTAKATDEISQQIRDMQSETGVSVGRIETIGKTIAEMSEIATAIASAVEEQGAATREIARNVQEAAKGTGEVSSNISGVAAAASESGAAAAQVKATSGEVAQQGEGLRNEVSRFLEGIRAA